MHRVSPTIGRSLGALFRRHEPFVLVEGPAGTAKTRGILTVLLSRALRWPGIRILLTRATRESLSETVLTTLEQQVFPAFQIPVPGGAAAANRKNYRLDNGSVLVPLGADEGQRLFSSEWTFIYGAEATEFTDKQVAQLARSMRHFGAPFQQCILDCNPGPPGHWLNQRAEAVDPTLRFVKTRADYERLQLHNNKPATDPLKRWKRIVTKYQDNPGYWDHAAWDWTPIGRHYVTTNLGTLTGFMRKRLVDGLWVGAEGTVYPEFDEARHAIKPFDVPESWPWFVGLDPGYDHPCAILWFTVAPNGCIYIADEVYRGGVGVPEHGRTIHAHNAGRTVRGYYADPQHAFSKTAQSPESIAQQFAASAKINFAPWPRTAGNEEAMVADVRQLLERDMLKVFQTCTNTIQEFQTWSYKRTLKGELPPGEDAFEDSNNHAMDVVKGVVATKPRHDGLGIMVESQKKKPVDARRRRRQYIGPGVLRAR